MKVIVAIIFFIFLQPQQSQAQQRFDSLRNSISRIDSLKNVPLRLLPSNYYTTNFGFFCKKELQLEKAIKIPVRIRLGSVEAVDRMEGKGTGRN